MADGGWSVGDIATLCDLQNASHLNGEPVIVGEWLEQRQRYQCTSRSGGKSLAIKPINLQYRDPSGIFDPMTDAQCSGDGRLTWEQR